MGPFPVFHEPVTVLRRWSPSPDRNGTRNGTATEVLNVMTGVFVNSAIKTREPWNGTERSELVKQIETTYAGKRPQTVCVRSVSRKSRDLDALGSREVMVVMKWMRGSVRVRVSESGRVSVSECECE